METIGDRIKIMRKKCGYTQSHLAQFLYFSDKTISSWEMNRTKPDIKSLCVLSETLNTTIDYLLYGNKERIKDEVEIKVRVTDDEYLRVLNDVSRNAKLIDRIKQNDEYFKTGNNYSFLRVREEKNSVTLSLKKKLKNNNYSKENVTVGNKESIASILNYLGCKSIGVIEKERIIYNYSNDYTILFDCIHLLGKFIEFKSINNSYEELISICKHFSINIDNIEERKYIEMKSQL